MVAPVFTDEELESLRRFPEIGRKELFRFFTLRRTVRSSTRARAADRLGPGVVVCMLPWLGFVPETLPRPPPAAVAPLAEQPRVPLPTRCVARGGRGGHPRCHDDHGS